MPLDVIIDADAVIPIKEPIGFLGAAGDFGVMSETQIVPTTGHFKRSSNTSSIATRLLRRPFPIVRLDNGFAFRRNRTLRWMAVTQPA